MTGVLSGPRSWSSVAWAVVAGAAGLNAVAALAYAPSEHLQRVSGALVGSPLSNAVVLGTPWSVAAAIGLVSLAWGLLRRRRVAWALLVALLVCFAATDVLRHEPPPEVALPLLAALALVVVRDRLVAEPFRRSLSRHMRSGPRALDRASELIEKYGCDTLAPFKARPDVGHLFSAADDAVLAFRVENRSLLVAADPVGTPEGTAEVLQTAQRLARGLGLRFGVVAASEPLAAFLRQEMGMHSIYLGCEAILDPASFSLQGRKIKKVRQAHARILRAGITLSVEPLAALSPLEICELERCRAASRGQDTEQSFAMAPDSLRARALDGAIVVRALKPGSDGVAGAMIFSALRQRSLWSLALQMRDPASPNGVVDALVVHALSAAEERGVAEVSLNFAAARRYLHEPVRGWWPNVARLLARIATSWTQIDTLRAHNEKFSPRWEQRFLVTDRLLHVPHLVFATIWQEGQMPRPTGLLSPAWPLPIAGDVSTSGQAEPRTASDPRAAVGAAA